MGLEMREKVGLSSDRVVRRWRCCRVHIIPGISRTCIVPCGPRVDAKRREPVPSVPAAVDIISNQVWRYDLISVYDQVVTHLVSVMPQAGEYIALPSRDPADEALLGRPQPPSSSRHTRHVAGICLSIYIPNDTQTPPYR